MTEATGMDRRVTKLEDGMDYLGKCVIRLETTQKHIIETSGKREVSQDKWQGEMLEKLDAVHQAANGTAKEPVTFKWLAEKIFIPILLGGGSTAVAIYTAIKILSGG